MEQEKRLLLLVTYHVRPGQRTAFLQRLNDAGIPAAVRREDGCRRYDYFLDTQDPDAILLVEDWDTTAHQQAHVQTPHMALFQTFKPDYVLSTDAQRILL